ncbi:adenylyl-sulfate kinase [Pseudonocardia sp. CA-142604]|uniref:adenylyl-sulfate kinase n=1 Tax=Pseudonocardia sp. CA-142604 TaxID=3240024 RepID=UPI003D94356A
MGSSSSTTICEPLATGSTVITVLDWIDVTGSEYGLGITVWFTGLPSSGKSTIAAGLAAQLRDEGLRVEVLDGDEIRRNLTPDLGFSRADREENVRRIGHIATLLARNGVIVLVPVIAPYAEARDKVRAAHAESGVKFFEVYVAAPADVCADRDVKGLYALQRAGRLTGLTGVDDPYEPPAGPELTIPTHVQTVDESIRTVRALLPT